MVRFLLTIAVALGSLNLSWAAQQFDEYQVKAAFVANFAGFVEWPLAAFHELSDPFTICVVGRRIRSAVHSPNVAAGKSVAGRTSAARDRNFRGQTGDARARSHSSVRPSICACVRFSIASERRATP